MSSLHYVTDGRHATRCAQKARRAVVAGRARWLHERPVTVEVRQPATTPTRHARTPFGFGLGERNPVYRAPVDLDSMAWWEAQNALEIERDLERRFEEFRAMERLSSGLDAY